MQDKYIRFIFALNLKTNIMNKIKGYVIYEGKSEINGGNIVAIVTLNSKNIKTGDMASMWILNADLPPTKASQLGLDESVCGDCVHRHFSNGSCYVTLFQAPLQVYKAWQNGNYPMVTDMSIFKDMSIRFGAYGDPYALPIDILTSIKGYVKNNTSYTHQWQQGNDALKKISMASVDSIIEAKVAQKNGWRTFRVTNDINTLMDSEIICPNTTHGIKCIDCKLCSGYSKAKSIVILTHGAKSKKFIEVLEEAI